MRITRRSMAAVVACTLVLATGVAFAAPKEMLLCLPGFPGTQVQAQPYVDKMLRYLEKKLEWPPLSLTGLYLPDGELAASQLADKKPWLALVGPSVYAGQAKKLGMQIIAQVEANGRGEETYSVIARKDGPAKIEALAGKKLEGAVVHDEKYLLNVLLERRLKPGALKLESEKRPLKALRDVVRGEADAAIVDRSVVESLSTFEGADQLQVIFTAKPVPSPVVVVMGEGKKEAERLRKILTGMCELPDGRELCQTLTISSIKIAPEKGYAKLMKLYNR